MKMSDSLTWKPQNSASEIKRQAQANTHTQYHRQTHAQQHTESQEQKSEHKPDPSTKDIFARI